MPALRRRWGLLVGALAWRAGFVLAPMQAPLAAGLIVAALAGEQTSVFGLDLGGPGTPGPLHVGVGMLAAISLVTAVAAYWRSVTMSALSRSIVAELRGRAVGASFEAPQEVYERLGPAEIQDRIVNDCGAVRRFVDRVFVQAAVNVLRIGYPSVMLFVIDWFLALLVAAVMIPQVTLTSLVIRALHGATRRTRSQRAKLNRHIAEMVRTRDESARPEAIAHIDALEDREMSSQRLSALNMSLVWLFTGACVAVVWGVGSSRVAAGSLGVGEIVAFAGMLAFVHQPMRQFAMIAGSSRKGIVALERLEELFGAGAGAGAGTLRIASPPPAPGEGRRGESTA